MSNRGTTARAWAPLAWFGLTALVGGGVDLASKAWAEQTLGGLPGRAMMVQEPWLEFALAYNRGTAFSLMPDLGAARWIFGLAALATAVVLLVIVVRSRAGRYAAIALGTIAAGAIGNGIDRVFHLAPGGGTGVVDFIKINYPWGGSWPTFNIADVLVAIGAGMLILRIVRARGKLVLSDDADRAA
ncbi:MAG TPA: signal peptidase II [Haliangium sp.]|nr:signal peptidase II [Haliangium sp.]